MSEEKLRNIAIKNKIQGICQDCIYLDKIVPIINEMTSRQYIHGLQQGKFDKEMDLENETFILKEKAINYYLKTLAKKQSMPEEAVMMFNILEGNVE